MMEDEATDAAMPSQQRGGVESNRADTGTEVARTHRPYSRHNLDTQAWVRTCRCRPLEHSVP